MEATPELKVALASFVHEAKEDSPIDVTVEGTERLVKALHPEKAVLPIEVTVDPQLIVANLLSLSKALSPTVNPVVEGRVTLVKEPQLEKQEEEIVVSCVALKSQLVMAVEVKAPLAMEFRLPIEEKETEFNLLSP